MSKPVINSEDDVPKASWKLFDDASAAKVAKLLREWRREREGLDALIADLAGVRRRRGGRRKARS